MNCQFCHEGEEAEMVCGKLRQVVNKQCNCVAHQKCMQYSSNLRQYQFEQFGGFVIEDVEEEIKRGQKLKCCICKKKGATAGCSYIECSRKTYHYPCASRSPKVIVRRFERFASQDIDGTTTVFEFCTFCSEKHLDVYTRAMGLVDADSMCSDSKDNSENMPANDSEESSESISLLQPPVYNVSSAIPNTETSSFVFLADPAENDYPEIDSLLNLSAAGREAVALQSNKLVSADAGPVTNAAVPSVTESRHIDDSPVERSPAGEKTSSNDVCQNASGVGSMLSSAVNECVADFPPALTPLSARPFAGVGLKAADDAVGAFSTPHGASISDVSFITPLQSASQRNRLSLRSTQERRSAPLFKIRAVEPRDSPSGASSARVPDLVQSCTASENLVGSSGETSPTVCAENEFDFCRLSEPLVEDPNLEFLTKSKNEKLSNRGREEKETENMVGSPSAVFDDDVFGYCSSLPDPLADDCIAEFSKIRSVEASKKTNVEKETKNLVQSPSTVCTDDDFDHRGLINPPTNDPNIGSSKIKKEKALRKRPREKEAESCGISKRKKLPVGQTDRSQRLITSFMSDRKLKSEVCESAVAESVDPGDGKCQSLVRRSLQNEFEISRKNDGQMLSFDDDECNLAAGEPSKSLASKIDVAREMQERKAESCNDHDTLPQDTARKQKEVQKKPCTADSNLPQKTIGRLKKVKKKTCTADSDLSQKTTRKPKKVRKMSYTDDTDLPQKTMRKPKKVQRKSYTADPDIPQKTMGRPTKIQVCTSEFNPTCVVIYSREEKKEAERGATCTSGLGRSPEVMGSGSRPCTSEPNLHLDLESQVDGGRDTVPMFPPSPETQRPSLNRMSEGLLHVDGSRVLLEGHESSNSSMELPNLGANATDDNVNCADENGVYDDDEDAEFEVPSPSFSQISCSLLPRQQDHVYAMCIPITEGALDERNKKGLLKYAIRHLDVVDETTFFWEMKGLKKIDTLRMVLQCSLYLRNQKESDLAEILFKKNKSDLVPNLPVVESSDSNECQTLIEEIGENFIKAELKYGRRVGLLCNSRDSQFLAPFIIFSSANDGDCLARSCFPCKRSIFLCKRDTKFVIPYSMSDMQKTTTEDHEYMNLKWFLESKFDYSTVLVYPTDRILQNRNVLSQTNRIRSGVSQLVASGGDTIFIFALRSDPELLNYRRFISKILAFAVDELLTCKHDVCIVFDVGDCVGIRCLDDVVSPFFDEIQGGSLVKVKAYAGTNPAYSPVSCLVVHCTLELPTNS